MAFEFPYLDYNLNDFNAVLHTIKHLIDTCEAIKADYDRLVTVTSEYPQQWQSDIAASVNAIHQSLMAAIQAGDETVWTNAQAKIAELKTYVDAELLQIQSRVEASLEAQDEKLADYNNTILRMQADLNTYYAQWIKFQQEINSSLANMQSNISAIQNSTEESIDSIRQDWSADSATLHGEISNLQSDIAVLRSMIKDAAIVVRNPLNGKFEKTGQVINLLFHYLRKYGCYDCAELAGLAVTYDDIKNAHITCYDFSVENRRIIRRKYNNPVTGLKRSFYEILSTLVDENRGGN